MSQETKSATSGTFTVTEEDIQKALDTLSIIETSEEELETIVKGEAGEGDAGEGDKKKKKTNAKVEDGKKETGDEEEEEEEEEEDTMKGKKKASMKKGEATPAAEPESDEVSKGASIEDIQKALTDSLSELERNSNKNFQSVAVLMKGILGEIAEIKKSVSDVATAPMGRKSITSRPVERQFDDINKGGEGDDKLLHVQRDRNRILEIMDDMTFSKGYNDNMAKAMTYFESTGSMTRDAALMIEKESGFRVVA